MLKCKRHKQIGPALSRASPRRILREATMSQPLVRRQLSCMATDTQMCSSSQPKQLTHHSGLRLPMPCLTLLERMQLRKAMMRTVALQSMVAKAGQRSSSTITRLTSTAMLLSPWAPTTSPVLKTAARPRWSTPSATRRMTMARFASSCTTHRCRSLPLRLPSPSRKLKTLKRPGQVPLQESPKSTLMQATTSLQLVRPQASCTAMAKQMCSSSQPRQPMCRSGLKLPMPCLTLSGKMR
mmetsp:Transcript_49799/g.89426  ORF Transcript_49799/g.89426 Transcript_49799/m.89426 type:complete len:239 (-) Transcript_49799:122-838(-)